MVLAAGAMDPAEVAVPQEQALRFRFSTDPRLYRWSLKFLAECTAARAHRITLR